MAIEILEKMMRRRLARPYARVEAIDIDEPTTTAGRNTRPEQAGRLLSTRHTIRTKTIRDRVRSEVLMRAARLLLVASLALVTPLAAQERYAQEIRQLESFIESRMKDMQMPALSVAVVHGDFTWSKGFGLADVENNVPATADSSYRMASVTKPMTATAVMRLVEQGKIDLDAEVQRYVPDFPRKQHPVTVRQLLQHLGGISHYREYNVEGRIREPKNTKESLAIFKDFDLIAEPGTRYSYSSYGYNLLGAVIEGASGKTYADFMRSEIWQPLGMTNTRMDDPRTIIPNRVRGYVIEGGTLRNSEYVDISSRFAGGGTRSTVGDMMKFIIGVADGKVVKPESVETMFTTGVTREGTATRYGLGFVLTPQGGRYYVGHSGSQQETRTDLAWFPRERFGYALATNFENADLPTFSAAIARAFLGDNWNANFYVPERADQSILQAMGITWNNGLAFHDRHLRAQTNDARELASAFRYLNDAMSRKRLSALSGEDKIINQGRHPVAGQPFIRAGSYMAAALAASGKDLEVYHREGELAFFDDYIRLYRSSRSIPRAYRFDPSVEALISRWRSEWKDVWGDEFKILSVVSARDVDTLANLASRLRGRSIIPNYVDSLIGFGQSEAQRGNGLVAARVAGVLLDLYPESAAANGFAGVMAVVTGDLERGRTLLIKSRERDPRGYASAENLQRIAGVLERGGNKTAAEALRSLR